ncbi:hypothetical protein, partial [Paracoccus alkenifer]
MNNRNTVGEAVFIRDTRTFPAPKDDDPLPGSMAASLAFEPYQVAQASTGTMSDATWGAAPQSGTARPSGAAGTSVPAPGQTVPRVAWPRLILRRLGIFGLILEEEMRRADMTPTARQQEDLARRIAGSSVGRFVIRQDRLLGGQEHVSNPLRLFSPSVWEGKYGVIAGPLDHVPMANDILGRLAGRPVNMGEMTLEEIDGILAPFAGLSDDEVEAKLAEIERRQRAAVEERDPDPEPEQEPQPDPIIPGTTVTISAREEYRKKCQVDRYAVMRNICGQYGMQAHHIVPDWTLRYGARGKADQRIPNMPSLNDGMAICVMGHATKEDTEHNHAHFADAAIEAIGKTSTPPHTATVAQVRNESFRAMARVRPDCRAQIFSALVAQFGTRNPNQLLRAKRRPPLPQETINALRSGASYPLQ